MKNPLHFCGKWKRVEEGPVAEKLKWCFPELTEQPNRGDDENI